MKSNSLNKLMKININIMLVKSMLLMAFMMLMSLFSEKGSAAGYKIDKNSYFKLEADVAKIINSPVADAAPLEIKFIKEKLQLAKKAKANRKKKLEAQYTEQIYADIEIAKMRAELNQLNNLLLDKRDQVSAAQAYLAGLKERLK